MAKPKKGALAQFMVPMVDATDFASIESGITESDFNSGATRKWYGVDHGTSAAATSGAVSKLASLVRSGVFRVTLKGTENAYDLMQLRISKTGCAEQIFEWENVDHDDSDLRSAITALASLASDAHSAAAQANSRVLLAQSMVSDVQSALLVVQSMASDAASAAQQGASRALLLISSVSDLQSALSNAHSDLRSQISGISAVVGASAISDIASAVDAALASRLSDILSAAQQTNSRVLVVQSMASDIRSNVSDLQSDFQSRVPKLVATASQVSDAHSDLRSAIGAISVVLTASDISDIASAVVAAIGFDPSDIASAVNVELGSRLSDILSAAQQGNSRILVVLSQASDLQSQLSDVHSDLRSLIVVGVGLTLSAMSDVSSRVDSALASRLSDILSAAQQGSSRILVVQSMASDAHSAAAAGASRVLLNQSSLSDVYSLLSAFDSEFGSRVPKRVATESQLSDVLSDLRSALLGIQSGLSDVESQLDVTASVASDAASAAQQVNSRALLLLSQLSDVESQIDAGVPLDASTISDLRSAIAAHGVLRAGSDPTAVPAVNAAMADKVDWLTALARNKVRQTSSEQELLDDAGTSVIASAAVSDDGTQFERSEWS